MNRITHVWTTTLLLTLANVAVATTGRVPLAHNITPTVARSDRTAQLSQPQSIVAPKGKELIAKFDCRSRGPGIGEIALQANGKYTVAKQQKGKYVATPSGYRFSNGKLKGQSIVRQQGNIYLVSTKNAARAAEVAAADGALLCTGGEIKY